MKNKLIKLVMIVLVIANILSINYCYASDLIIKPGENTTIMSGDANITAKASPIYSIAKYITYTAAVIIVIYKGIQFMNSAADPEGKAKVKKELIAVAIGALLIFSIGELLTIIAKSSWSAVKLSSIKEVALTSQASLFGNIQSSANNFLQTGKNNQKITAQTAKDKILPIAGMLVAIATVVFLIVGGILGVQYMISGANERAQLKQKLIWFVIAVVVVYGASGIFNIAVNIMLKVTGES